ncbi:MAG: aminoglycoside phosphotransferase family protein [Alphaproteobacteria bacterium]
MSERDSRIRAFLAGAGWDGAEHRPLAGDASFRRYDRVFQGDRRAVLMDAPPAHEDVRPFVRVARHLTGLGFSAPAILAADEDAGLLLLEDLGDDLYTRVLAGDADEAALYAVAIDVLVALHAQAVSCPVPPYDDARLLAEADLLLDWFLPAVQGPVADEARADFHAAWLAVLSAAHALPGCLVLRDYHADNLIWLPRRSGLRRCGLLDFQDAVAGPGVYDVVSLLEDARRDVTPATVSRSLDRYLGQMGVDRAAFEAAYAVLGAQRNTKIVGIFTRLWRRDGKRQFLDLMPRVWAHIEHDLAHPALLPVRRWFDRHCPPALRRRP